MPNHVINEIVFDRPQAEHKAILESVLDQEGKVDFEILIPTPVHIWRGSVGQKHDAAFGRQNTGLDWARSNWGTKWNAYDNRPVISSESQLVIAFETAWSPPYPWLVALFNTHGEFRHNSLDEGCSYALEGRFFNGSSWPEWNEEKASDSNSERLHKLLWGDDWEPEQ